MSRYPVYVSPDGKHEQVAATPVRQVQLRHAGWRPKKDPKPTKTKTRTIPVLEQDSVIDPEQT